MSGRLGDERGSGTLWTLGLALTLLMVGGISIDLWSALGAHRDLAGIADAAAVAASSGVDQEVFRASGVVQLDPALATDLALRLVAAQPNGADLESPPAVTVVDGGIAVVVALERRVPLTLLGLLVPDQSIVVAAEGRADASLRE